MNFPAKTHFAIKIRVNCSKESSHVEKVICWWISLFERYPPQAMSLGKMSSLGMINCNSMPLGARRGVLYLRARWLPFSARHVVPCAYSGKSSEVTLVFCLGGSHL